MNPRSRDLARERALYFVSLRTTTAPFIEPSSASARESGAQHDNRITNLRCWSQSLFGADIRTAPTGTRRGPSPAHIASLQTCARVT